MAWRRRWLVEGEAALALAGPSGAPCRLIGCPADAAAAAHWTRVRPLRAGPRMQRWTLARVATLIGRLFHQRYTLRGVSLLLHRIGYTPAGPGPPRDRA